MDDIEDVGCSTRDVVSVLALVVLGGCAVAAALIITVARHWPW